MKHYNGWQKEDLTEEDIELEVVESEETPINGIKEYGFGFWSRFQWNSRQL